MKRTLYLIRHAMPNIPIGQRWCVGGRTDLTLGEPGLLQAALLPFAPELEKLDAVFCSSMLRARETALALCPEPRIIPGLEEQDMGAWDGLSFEEIKARFPALYAARETESWLLPEGAESEEAVRIRMEAALDRCLEESAGDIAVVSHKGAIAAVAGGREGLDYTALTALRYENGRLVSVEKLGPPHPALTERVCEALLGAAGCRQELRAHCRAVAALAEELCGALLARGMALDAEAIRAAALLHDIAKGRPEHAALGGVWLRELGYPEIADLIRQHTEPDGTELNAAALVYIADKGVRGDRRIAIDERFEASLAKCRTPEALAAHTRRWNTAKEIQNKINRLCGAELLP